MRGQDAGGMAGRAVSVSTETRIARICPDRQTHHLRLNRMTKGAAHPDSALSSYASPRLTHQVRRTSTGASRRITMREPAGSTASTSAVPIAIAVPAAAPITAPLIVELVFLPST